MSILFILLFYLINFDSFVAKFLPNLFREKLIYVIDLFFYKELKNYSIP